MNTDRHLPLPAKSIAAVLLVLVCVMFFMEWANVAFRIAGYSQELVHYASRILGLPVMALLVWLVVRQHRGHLRKLFSTNKLTIRLALTCIVVGFLARLFWWSQITARAAFGWLESSRQALPQTLDISFACPELPVFLSAMLVGWILVPLTEEFIHRGVLLSAFANRGPVLAIGLSALIFASMHRPGSFWFVFLFGVVFGVLFWNSRTLWAPVIVHATYDGIIVFDWYCLKTAWNPSPGDLPLTTVGIASGALSAVCAVGIAFLISRRWVGLRTQPNP